MRGIWKLFFGFFDNEEGVSPKIRKNDLNMQGFILEVFLVKELRDSELGWMRYKLAKFIDKT